MKALITGASGFFGSHLVDECVRRGDQVRVLVRPTSDLGYLRTVPGLEFAAGDLGDREALARASTGVDVVYHSAARAQEQGCREQFWADNVAGTLNLLAAARSAGVGRFVHVSSPSVVMTGRDQLDLDESAPYPDRFLNLYSETKAVAEQAVLAANEPGFVSCALRPRAIWGPRDRTGFLPRLLARLVAGTLPDLSGDRPVYASLCYCVNAARACRQAGDSDRVGGRAYFIADRERTDVWALIAEVAHRFDVAPPSRRIPAPIRDAAATVVDALWRIPAVARRRPPPFSRYAVALLTRSGTYDTRAAGSDFGYRPQIDQPTGLLLLQRWIDDIGGLGALVQGVHS